MTVPGNIGLEILGRLRTDARAHVDAAYTDGFTEAAGICIELLNGKIDELTAKIPAGNFLSESEQLLLASLHALKSETEETLREAWQGADSSG